MTKEKITQERHMPPKEAAAHLEALAEGIRAGKLRITQGDKSMELVPAEVVTVEVEAKRKKDRFKFSLELEWEQAAGADQDIDITAVPAPKEPLAHQTSAPAAKAAPSAKEGPEANHPGSPKNTSKKAAPAKKRKKTPAKKAAPSAKK